MACTGYLPHKDKLSGGALRSVLQDYHNGGGSWALMLHKQLGTDTFFTQWSLTFLWMTRSQIIFCSVSGRFIVFSVERLRLINHRQTAKKQTKAADPGEIPEEVFGMLRGLFSSPGRIRNTVRVLPDDSNMLLLTCAEPGSLQLGTGGGSVG